MGVCDMQRKETNRRGGQRVVGEEDELEQSIVTHALKCYEGTSYAL